MQTKLPHILTAGQVIGITPAGSEVALSQGAVALGDRQCEAQRYSHAARSFVEDSAALCRRARIFDASPPVRTEKIAAMLRMTPPVILHDGVTLEGINALPETYDACVSGKLRYLALENLHRLLSAERGLSKTLVVDNAPGSLPHLAALMAMLGSRVLVKEQSPNALIHAFHSLALPADVGSRILYCGEKFQRGHILTPANIVYWTKILRQRCDPEGISK